MLNPNDQSLCHHTSALQRRADCPICRGEGYSAPQVTNWLCPYCEQSVSDARHEYDCAKTMRAKLERLRRVETAASALLDSEPDEQGDILVIERCHWVALRRALEANDGN